MGIKGLDAYGSCFWAPAGVKCPDVQAPKFGIMKGDSFAFPDTLEFECQSGYVRQGDAMLECLHTARWSGKPPFCKREC